MTHLLSLMCGEVPAGEDLHATLFSSMAPWIDFLTKIVVWWSVQSAHCLRDFFLGITLQFKVPDVVCVASNAFGRGHMKARVLEFVGCHDILWKSVLTSSFSMSFLAASWATAGWFLLAGHGPLAKNREKASSKRCGLSGMTTLL